MTDYKSPRRPVSDSNTVWGVVVFVALLLALSFAGESDYQSLKMLDQPTGATMQARR